MGSHRKVWPLLQRSLSGEAVAKIVIAEAERMDRGEPPLWTDAEIKHMKQPLVRDAKARRSYARLINRWCQEHGIESTLEEIDPPSKVSLEGMVRFHIIDRYMAWERPKVEALESYRDARGYQAWKQHPWEPSGIERVSADPEAAWADFVEWSRDAYQSAEPPMRKETYLRVFTENKPYHPWQLRQPSEPRPS